MGVLSRVRDMLETLRDDDVVAERGLHLLGLLAEADENKVDVDSALRRVFSSASLIVMHFASLYVRSRGLICYRTGTTHGCSWNCCGSAGRPSGAVGGR